MGTCVWDIIVNICVLDNMVSLFVILLLVSFGILFFYFSNEKVKVPLLRYAHGITHIVPRVKFSKQAVEQGSMCSLWWWTLMISFKG